MKRRSTFLVILFVLMISSLVSASGNRMQISMNGDKLSVMQAPIVMNGEKISKKVPSFVHNDRTLVHIRFIEENSDAKVSWEQETKTVIVEFEGSEVKLSIDNTVATINGEQRMLDKGSIPRLVKYEGEKNSITMVPLRLLGETLGFEVGWDNKNNNAYINSSVKEPVEPENKFPIDKDTPKEEKPQAVAKNIINNIEVSKGSTDKNKLIIRSNKKLSYTTQYIERENKLVVDLIGSKLEINSKGDAPGIININDNLIKQVRYSQFSSNPYITRLVIDLKKYQEPNIIQRSDGTGLSLSFESQSIGKITKENEGIVIKGAKKGNMRTMRLQNPDRIVMDFLDSTLEGNPYVEYPYDLGFINKVRVSQFLPDKNYSDSDQIVRIVLDIKGQIKNPNIKIESLGDDIIIYPEKISEEDIDYKTRDRLIVIDAGHGGKDPGASSVTKKKEKDFNLTVSKKFNEKLKALGYNTIMTRDTDVFIDLYERTRIANNNNADIFVSIHANAFSNNSSIEGIEVLHYPSSTSDSKHSLHQIMLDELLKGTGAKSRGTIKRPKLVVLRETKMPAVLVEAGFLTNPKEEKLLFTDSYQNIIVDSMVKGVEKYFEMN